MFLNSKSRFYFNISITQNLKFCLKKIFNVSSKNQYSNNLISDLYKESDIYHLEHGRSAFYLFLTTLKKKTNKRKIIINSFTLFEMINMIIYSDFEPLLVDLKSNSFETNLENIIEKNKDDLAAVVITHLNGFNENIFQVKENINRLNKNRTEKIFLIEDCAVSLGAKKNSFYAGKIGDYAILSFNIMKNITTLTGGVLIDNYKRLERLKKLYPDNYDDHVKNMSHLSEKGELQFSNHSRTLHLNSGDSLENIKYNIEYFINKFK